MQRRQFTAALAAFGTGGLAGCGSQSQSTAVGQTEAATNGGWSGPAPIAAGDDAQSIIESAQQGSWLVVEPGSTHHVTPPFDIPTGVVLDGGPPSTGGEGRTRFVKDGDGDMARIGGRTIIRGIHFSGERDSRTGDGLVDRAWNQGDIALLGVRIDGMAGDARVRNATSRWYHRNCRLVNNGGWAIRSISTDHDGPRRGQMVNGQLRRNDKGCIYVAPGARERDNHYHLRAQNNGGPVFAHDPRDEGATSYNLRFLGSYADNAGPAIVSTSKRLMGVTVGGRLGNNATDIQQATANTDVSITRPVGDHIHFEGGDHKSTITVPGGLWRPGGGPGPAAVAHHGGERDARLGLTVSGGEARGEVSVVGAVKLSILNGDDFDVDWSGARGGIELSASEGVTHRAP